MSAKTEFWDKLYEKSGSSNQSPFTVALHKKVLQVIPDDVETVLDAGCGGGSLMTFLSKNGKYRIEGVDQSTEGIRFIKEKLSMKAQVGDITNMSQFRDNSFDLLICSEVLEHLPKKVLEAAVREFSRVAKKYLIITNPFREKLTFYQLTCNNCLTRYHPAGHIQSIDESFMTPIVSPWAESVSFYYSGERQYGSPLYSALLRMAGYRLFSSETSCPLCGNEVPHKKWGIPVRISGHTHQALQKILKFLGIKRAANIITFVKTK